jgi:N-dimethylarginine dimethylaminohydrolase
MVRPTYFDVEYSSNPLIDPGKPTSSELAVVQWEWLYRLYLELGHRVDQIDPRPGLPDMVFAASGATVVDGHVLVARFRHADRADESAVFLDWFKTRGYRRVRQAKWVSEGGRDHLVAGPRILAGSWWGSSTQAHEELHETLGRPVVELTVVEPRYYQLDTALAVLDDDAIMYYPPAFSADSRRVLDDLYPDAIRATDEDAAGFGLNAVSDGRHVVLPEAATGLIAQLRARGFEPIGADVSELLRAGGAVRSCTLELHAA